MSDSEGENPLSRGDAPDSRAGGARSELAQTTTGAKKVCVSPAFVPVVRHAGHFLRLWFATALRQQRFHTKKYVKMRCSRFGRKGFGLQVLEPIQKGMFLIEYVGEPFHTINSHLGDLLCKLVELQNEELTFDYNFELLGGAHAKKCYCGTVACRGFIGRDATRPTIAESCSSDDSAPEPLMREDYIVTHLFADSLITIILCPAGVSILFCLFKILLETDSAGLPEESSKLETSSVGEKSVQLEGFLNLHTLVVLSGLLAVELVLEGVLDERGGIYKKKATEFLKIFVLLTATSNLRAASSRDLSLLLDALLKTHSANCLTKIVVGLNGIRSLQTLARRLPKAWDKTPVLRKLLRVFEHLAKRQVLTKDLVTRAPAANAAMGSQWIPTSPSPSRASTATILGTLHLPVNNIGTRWHHCEPTTAISGSIPTTFNGHRHTFDNVNSQQAHPRLPYVSVTNIQQGEKRDFVQPDPGGMMVAKRRAEAAIAAINSALQVKELGALPVRGEVDRLMHAQHKRLRPNDWAGEQRPPERCPKLEGLDSHASRKVREGTQCQSPSKGSLDTARSDRPTSIALQHSWLQQQQPLQQPHLDSCDQPLVWGHAAFDGHVSSINMASRPMQAEAHMSLVTSHVPHLSEQASLLQYSTAPVPQPMLTIPANRQDKPVAQPASAYLYSAAPCKEPPLQETAPVLSEQKHATPPSEWDTPPRKHPPEEKKDPYESWPHPGCLAFKDALDRKDGERISNKLIPLIITKENKKYQDRQRKARREPSYNLSPTVLAGHRMGIRHCTEHNESAHYRARLLHVQKDDERIL
eukprot:SM000099S25256  [mRNA]  locus=s99:409698:416390:- [translate_table: standard]